MNCNHKKLLLRKNLRNLRQTFFFFKCKTDIKKKHRHGNKTLWLWKLKEFEGRHHRRYEIKPLVDFVCITASISFKHHSSTLSHCTFLIATEVAKGIFFSFSKHFFIFLLNSLPISGAIIVIYASIKRSGNQFFNPSILEGENTSLFSFSSFFNLFFYIITIHIFD